MDDEEDIEQRALVRALRQPRVSFEPQLGIEGRYATYGGDARAEIPLSKNTTLSVSGGGEAGRRLGKHHEPTSPFKPRANVELRYEF